MPGRLIKLHVGGEITKPHQKTWRLLVRKWAKVLNEYLKRANGEDLPQWHIERSHTGFLAAAIWKTARGVALEEYAVGRKPAKSRRRQKTNTPGRCDLYFNVNGLDCVIEAKHDWAEGTGDEMLKRIKRKLNDAKRQLKALPSEERAEVGIYLCWIVPELKGNGENGDDFLKKISEKFITQDSIVAIYHVPSKERKDCESQYGKGNTFPGVVLVGRQQWS